MEKQHNRLRILEGNQNKSQHYGHLPLLRFNL